MDQIRFLICCLLGAIIAAGLINAVVQLWQFVSIFEYRYE